MNKILSYISFVSVSFLDASIFITSTDYTQLIIAIVLYIPLAYVAFKLFPRKSSLASPATQSAPVPTNTIQPNAQEGAVVHASSDQQKSEEVEILDIDKRAFLKIIGATGLAFFITSLINRRFGTFLGRVEAPGTTKIQDPSGNLVDPAKNHPTDNYKISEVDYGVNSYYGFMDDGEGWFIMREDLNEGTYRYAKGDANFLVNWNNREHLNYGFFNQVFSKS